MVSDAVEDDFPLNDEPVERRIEPRGPVRGLYALLPGDDEPSEVVEAGLRGLFVACTELDRFAMRERFDITLSRDHVSLACQVEVVRKESGPRYGFALAVVDMSDDAAETFDAWRS